MSVGIVTPGPPRNAPGPMPSPALPSAPRSFPVLDPTFVSPGPSAVDAPLLSITPASGAGASPAGRAGIGAISSGGSIVLRSDGVDASALTDTGSSPIWRGRLGGAIE